MHTVWGRILVCIPILFVPLQINQAEDIIAHAWSPSKGLSDTRDDTFIMVARIIYTVSPFLFSLTLVSVMSGFSTVVRAYLCV